MNKPTFVLLLAAVCCAFSLAAQDKKVEQKKKETAAVLDFKAVKGLSTSDVVTLTSKFRSSLAKTKVYDVLERSDMESLLKEQDMSLSDMCDNTDCAVQVGKMLVAKKMVIGEIGKISETYSITVRIIDVSSGKLDYSESEDFKGATEGLLPVFDRLAQKLTGTYKAPKNWLYIIGGVALAGGGAAVVLALGGKKGASTASVGNPPTQPNIP